MQLGKARKISIIILGFAPFFICAQSPAFYHLGTAEGLTDNNVNTARIDQNGILWIGTSEGLNSFDGHAVTNYYKYNYPALPDNNIRSIEIDNHNWVWLRTSGNRLVAIDEKRRFHAVIVGDSTDTSPVTAIMNNAKYGIIALKGNSHYVMKNRNQLIMQPLKFTGDQYIPSTIGFFFPLDKNRMVLYGDQRLVVVDYANLQVTMNRPMPKLAGGAVLNNNQLIVYPVDGKTFFQVNVSNGEIVKTFSNLRDQEQKLIAGNLRQMAKIDDHRFAITTRFSGLYILDLQSRTLQHWYHDPLDDKSIGGNNTFRVHYDSTGYLLVTTQSSGLHYLNLKKENALHKPYFKDENGEIFDGFIESITTSHDGTVFLGAQDRLIRWDKKNDKTSFIQARLPGGKRLHGEETIRVVDIDEEENLWIGTTRYGILILDKNFNTVTNIISSDNKSLPSNWINAITIDNHGNKWIGTLRGIAFIGKKSFQVKSLASHPVLNQINNLSVTGIWFDSYERMWIGTSSGMWCYTPVQKKLTVFNTSNGLPNNNILSFTEDNDGIIYIGTPSGLSSINKKGTIETFNRSNGLRNDKCEDLLKDDKGFIWIGNLNCVLRFNPQAKKFTVFNDGHGISRPGFRIRSGHKTSTGELFWGSDKGVMWFHPVKMKDPGVQPPMVTAVAVRDTVYYYNNNETLHFPYNTTDLRFLFSPGELSQERKNVYQYKLSGFDPQWKTSVLPGQVVYHNLPPGNYKFEMQASIDGINWVASKYPVGLTIAKPWWQQTWFRLLSFALLVAACIATYNYLRRRKNSAEIKKMIDYFALSGYEHSSVDDILWDIARNCISRLNLEDCVIYLLDEERNVLFQKAAYGPKSPKEYEIANPIEIPVGEGIVGSVAASGKAEIVNDTSKDSRYIVDDERRFSEMAVPILHDGKVIGIIDSENKKKNFYNREQLHALQTIASLSSAKILRAMAMDAMKKSKAELLELNVKMAESKFLNLRLQMNPHFLFNSLSSIQHLIVSQQTTKAYKYLTVFSNFLRSLLHYAEENFIPLDEELKILKMYIELESLRFDESFKYEINIDEGLTNEEVLVPSLIIQPFAENAIWHGLLHKEGDKKLTIEFMNRSDEFLTCIISDNGIGREKAAQINANKISSRMHESRGINIIRERLDLLEKKTGKPAHVRFEDISDTNGNSAGTTVRITIPYYNPEAL